MSEQKTVQKTEQKQKKKISVADWLRLVSEGKQVVHMSKKEILRLAGEVDAKGGSLKKWCKAIDLRYNTLMKWRWIKETRKKLNQELSIDISNLDDSAIALIGPIEDPKAQKKIVEEACEQKLTIDEIKKLVKDANPKEKPEPAAGEWVEADKEIERLHTDLKAARNLPPLFEQMPEKQREKNVERLKEMAIFISELVDALRWKKNE